MFSSASMSVSCSWMKVMSSRLGDTNVFGMQFSMAVEPVEEPGQVIGFLEGQFLHEQVDPGVHLEAVEVVGVSLQPHEEAAVRHVGRAERRSASVQHD